jgi:hypothetical protein
VVEEQKSDIEISPEVHASFARYRNRIGFYDDIEFPNREVPLISISTPSINDFVQTNYESLVRNICADGSLPLLMDSVDDPSLVHFRCVGAVEEPHNFHNNYQNLRENLDRFGIEYNPYTSTRITLFHCVTLNSLPWTNHLQIQGTNNRFGYIMVYRAFDDNNNRVFDVNMMGSAMLTRQAAITSWRDALYCTIELVETS